MKNFFLIFLIFIFSSCSFLNKEDKEDVLLPEKKINEQVYNQDFSVDTST